MKFLLFLFSILLSANLMAQKVKIIKMNNDYFRHANVEGFFYLHDETTEDMFEWIGDIRIELDTIKPKTIKKVYNKLHERGNRLGANAFRVINSDIYIMGDQKFLDLGIYHLRKKYRAENLKLFQGQKVYMFGFLGHHKKIGGYKVGVNGDNVLLKSLVYRSVEAETGSILKLKLGRGLKKDEIKLKIDSDMLPRYYKFEVFSGLFNRSVISEHEWSFGELLIRILDKETLKL